jgi:hypothetical protein
VVAPVATGKEGKMRPAISLLTLLGILGVASVATADLRVKQRSHTDEYYYGGRVTPAENSESEIWIATDRMAYLSAHRQIIIDNHSGTFTFVNLDDSTYVESPLPFDWPKVVPEDIVATLARYRTHGTVENTHDVAPLDEWNCSIYMATSWIDTDEGKYNERDMKMWVTQDLPIDWQQFRAMHVHLLKVMNYDADLLEAFNAIPGFVVRTEADRFIQGFSVPSVEEVVEVQEAPPGPGVYVVPAGFEKKSLLSMVDLRG